MSGAIEVLNTKYLKIENTFINQNQAEIIGGISIFR